ncbi:MAG: DNA polymerase III subunit gamma/tau [Chlamydiae bacterium CG10_big_fil_rev_8_21_14_0_10_42_34]|nr:MAG: DNA polymerase III subunit gamma/tau [Chlamydiae bacterium CG10_big_fil_rev_8_21_14_0_10_42_34]
MSKRYQVLARKYRPQAFRDVVGQQAAVTTLKNAIRFDKIAHAYLFCGSRGVGKTTLARLFAKALNCQSLTQDLEPCNQCPSCIEITSGQSLDVIEIDGASNRGIDDIRQINETVGYAPSHGKYKIYIIDEVHMLTKEAFNALLKTLEEPPEQAKFFFATTEAHKVLPTIISRCQRFDLARIQPEMISSKLQQIATDLERIAEPDALELIASFSEGSLRDAESLFDQILCFAEDTITSSIVRKSLGLVPQELFLTLDEAFSNYQLSYAFELVDQLFQTGKDLVHFLEQLIEHYRNITLARTLNTPHPSAKLYTQSQALFILDLLINAESSFHKSVFQRIALESLLLQIIRSKHRIPVEVLVRKLTEQNEERPFQLPKMEEEPELALAPNAQAPLPPAPPKAEAPLPPAPPKAEELPPAPPKAEAPLPPAPPKAEAPLPPAPPKAEEPKLVATPFSPHQNKAEEPPKPTPSTSKHHSYYDTIIRFTAVELEGTVKK